MTVPAIFPDDTARVRRTDPSTSHEAADRSAVKVRGSQAAVLRVLAGSPAGRTDPELCYLVARYSDSRIRTARAELVELGLVEACGQKPTNHGTHHTIWRAK